MEISPWMAIALNALYAVLTGLTVPVVDSLGFPGHDAQVVAWAGLLAIPLNMLLHAFSAPQSGPAAPPPPKVVLDAQAVADLPSDALPGRVQIVKAIAKRAVDDHRVDEKS